MKRKLLLRINYFIQVAFVVYFVFNNCGLFAQNFEKLPYLRDMEVKSKDSLVTFQILTVQQNVKPVMSKRYFWYADGQIKSNEGGYFGSLLHGKYNVFNKSGNLITSGNFEKGLKDGKWMFWDNTGHLYLLINYSDGKLKGRPIRFDDKGNQVKPEKSKSSKSLFSWFKKDTATFKKDTIIEVVVKTDSVAVKKVDAPVQTKKRRSRTSK